MKTFTTILGFLSLSLACGLFGAGCHLGQPASASFASVVIGGKSGAQIRDAALAVFRENGFRAHASGQQLVFEREGSRANTVAYDGLVGAQAGAVTIIRVRADTGGSRNRFLSSSMPGLHGEQRRRLLLRG